jgi:catechol 2,3-dioxygenase-like lactoylglutathione lyase family enzyme
LAAGSGSRLDSIGRERPKSGITMTQFVFRAIDHVQLAMPPGEEERARTFYGGLLGMPEIEKPPELAKRGGCWFRSGSVEIHLGVEADFHPARKAHPGLRCHDYEGLTRHLRMSGVEIHEDLSLPGVSRCHIFDPFGNRIELIHA